MKKADCRPSRAVLCPTLADVDHVPRLDPLVLADHGDRLVLPVAPAHVVPGDHGVVGQLVLGFEHQRMAGVVRGLAELAADAAHRVAVDAVGADGLHVAGGGVPERHALRPRAHVPGHDREEHADAAAVEVGDHLPQARQPAGHVVQQVVLVAVVDADVRIDRPDQHGIDAAVARLAGRRDSGPPCTCPPPDRRRYRSSTITCGWMKLRRAQASSGRAYCPPS